MNLKKRWLIGCLSFIVLAVGSTAFALPPYASIIAYNQRPNGSQTNPNISTLGVLDIINMTPWDISIGPGPLQTPMLPNMTTGVTANQTSFWLAGIYGGNKAPAASAFGGGAAVVPNSSPQATVNTGYAFHSYQMALNNLNSVWQLNNDSYQSSPEFYYNQFEGWHTSIPIVFNNNNFTQGGNTASLNLIVSSSGGFVGMTYNPKNEGFTYFPATTFSYGDGTNNYGWESNDVYAPKPSDSGPNPVQTAIQFLEIQAQASGNNNGSNGVNWQPITAGLQPVAMNSGVACPTYLTVSGLAYKNFSVIAGDGMNLDLVVILQAGGYADMQLLFLAVPSGSNTLLTRASALRR